MDIRDFSFNLQKLYDDMALTFSSYQEKTELTCFSQCGRCCNNPDIEASIFEMLPLALKFHDQGTLEDWIMKLEDQESTPCLLFEALSQDKNFGRCGQYNERPSICRMFGVSGYFDKHGNKIHSVCKYIKEANPEKLTTLVASEDTPTTSHWSRKLSGLDPRLTQEKMPINLALKKACEKVAFYAQYQTF